MASPVGRFYLAVRLKRLRLPGPGFSEAKNNGHIPCTETVSGNNGNSGGTVSRSGVNPKTIKNRTVCRELALLA